MVLPLTVTVPVPCAAPKLVPVIVITAPLATGFSETLVMTGGGSTVKEMPLLTAPWAVTDMFPVVAPLGTAVTMLVLLQLHGVAVVPLNLILPEPWMSLKPVP